MFGDKRNNAPGQVDVGNRQNYTDDLGDTACLASKMLDNLRRGISRQPAKRLRTQQ